MKPTFIKYSSVILLGFCALTPQNLMAGYGPGNYFTSGDDILNLSQMPALFWYEESKDDFCRTFICDESFEETYKAELLTLRQQLIHINEYTGYTHAPVPELVVVGGSPPLSSEYKVHLRTRERTLNLSFRPDHKRGQYSKPSPFTIYITPDRIFRKHIGPYLQEYLHEAPEEQTQATDEELSELLRLLRHRRYRGCQFFREKSSNTVIWYRCPPKKKASCYGVNLKVMSPRLIIYEDTFSKLSPEDLTIELLAALQDYYLARPTFTNANRFNHEFNHVFEDQSPSTSPHNPPRNNGIFVGYDTQSLDYVFMFNAYAYHIWHLVEHHIASRIEEDLEKIDAASSQGNWWPQDDDTSLVTTLLFSRSEMAKSYFLQMQRLPSFNRAIIELKKNLSRLHGSTHHIVSEKDILFLVSYLYHDLPWEFLFEFQKDLSRFYHGQDPEYILDNINFQELEDLNYGLHVFKKNEMVDTYMLSGLIRSIKEHFSDSPMEYFNRIFLEISRHLHETLHPSNNPPDVEDVRLKSPQLTQLLIRPRKAHNTHLLDPDLFLVLYQLEQIQKNRLYLDETQDLSKFTLADIFFTHSPDALEIVDEIYALDLMSFFKKELSYLTENFRVSAEDTALSHHNLLLLTGVLYEYLPTELVERIQEKLFDFFYAFPFLQDIGPKTLDIFIKTDMGLAPRIILPNILKIRFSTILKEISDFDADLDRKDYFSNYLYALSVILYLHKKALMIAKENIQSQGYYLYTFNVRRDEELMSWIYEVGEDPNSLVDYLFRKIDSQHQTSQCLELLTTKWDASRNPLAAELDEKGQYSYCWRALHLKRLLEKKRFHETSDFSQVTEYLLPPL